MDSKKAIALAYEKNSLPKVIASGKNAMATLLIQKAREFNIPIFQNKELANALIALEVDDFIKEETFLAVAQIFVWLNENEKNAQMSR